MLDHSANIRTSCMRCHKNNRLLRFFHIGTISACIGFEIHPSETIAMKKTNRKSIALGVVAALAVLAAPIANASINVPNPISVDAGPLGKIGVQGIASAMGFWQDNPDAPLSSSANLGPKNTGVTVTNAMAIVQKDSGLGNLCTTQSDII